MKRFESGDVFKPAYQGQGFEPLQIPDTTALLRQNNQARLQEAKMFADQRMTDLKLEESVRKTGPFTRITSSECSLPIALLYQRVLLSQFFLMCQLFRCSII